MTYLVVAYVAMWFVHLGYLWSLGSRQRRLKEELEQLESRALNHQDTKTPRKQSG